MLADSKLVAVLRRGYVLLHIHGNQYIATPLSYYTNAHIGCKTEESDKERLRVVRFVGVAIKLVETIYFLAIYASFHLLRSAPIVHKLIIHE